MTLNMTALRHPALCTARHRAIAICALVTVCVAILGSGALAQTVSPLIVEATGKTSGKIELSNNTLVPMAVVMQPKSFDIDEEGVGVYRPLDAGIHLKLSATSFLLQPQESQYVFYKVGADKLPVWFTVYATFESVQKNPGLKVRIMLPHTVYLYQKGAIGKEAIHVRESVYDRQHRKIICEIENVSQSLIRVQAAQASGDKALVTIGGFPLLPNRPRHIEVEWKQRVPPESLLLRFPHFVVKEPIKER